MQGERDGRVYYFILGCHIQGDIKAEPERKEGVALAAVVGIVP